MKFRRIEFKIFPNNDLKSNHMLLAQYETDIVSLDGRIIF